MPLCPPRRVSTPASQAPVQYRVDDVGFRVEEVGNKSRVKGTGHVIYIGHYVRVVQGAYDCLPRTQGLIKVTIHVLGLGLGFEGLG